MKFFMEIWILEKGHRLFFASMSDIREDQRATANLLYILKLYILKYCLYFCKYLQSYVRFISFNAVKTARGGESHVRRGRAML